MRWRRASGKHLEVVGRRLSRLGYLLRADDGFKLRRAGVEARTVHTLRRVCEQSSGHPQTVLDVGAHEGGFLSIARAAFPNAAIHCFEPVQRSFDILRVAAAVAGPDVLAHRIALGRRDGVMIMHANDFSAASSFFEVSDEHGASFPETARSVRSESVQVRTLESWARDVPLKRPILLKLDVQGAELEVLDGAVGVLDDVDVMLIELSLVPMYVGAPLLADVVDAVARRGFRLAEFDHELRHPVTQQLLQIDALFTRSTSATRGDAG